MMDALFSSDALWFSVPAIVGSVVVLLRLILLVIGGDLGGDFDIDAGDFDGAGGGASVFSIQSIAVFLMGFGWAGLILYKGLDLPWFVGGLGGIAFGVALTALQVWLLSVAMGLQASGNIDIAEAAGGEGQVSVTIPEGGRGEVRMVINNQQKNYAAESATDEEIPRNTRVRVVESRPGTVTVEPIDAERGDPA